jgi:hypothetical protein
MSSGNDQNDVRTALTSFCPRDYAQFLQEILVYGGGKPSQYHSKGECHEKEV